MKILFDNQIFDIQKYGGVSRYFSELFKIFNKTENFDYELPIRDCSNEYLLSIKPFKEKNIPQNFLNNIKGKFLLQKIFDIFDNNSNRNLSIKSLKKQEFDIFHPTYYSTYFLKYLKGKPFVLTIHDMIHEKYPEYFPSDINRVAICKKKLALKAEKIIAISENTKKDIINFYGLPNDKIEVIYHGNSLKPISDKPKNAPEIPLRYILYVGSRSRYKNFVNFVKATASLLNKEKNLHIIAAGGYSVNNGFSRSEEGIFTELGIKNQILHYSINDEVLTYLYKNALCFVFPTLYEGFGMPILESFSCDCPVVASNTSSLPEIGGDAAVYFNPTDNQDMLKVIEMVINDDNLRKELILKGRKRLKDFSWERAAQQTMNLYKSII